MCEEHLLVRPKGNQQQRKHERIARMNSPPPTNNIHLGHKAKEIDFNTATAGAIKGI
jgi:hypothetical protein